MIQRLLLASGVALALAACDPRNTTNPTRLVPQGSLALGNVADPTSPAYFQRDFGDRVLFAVDQSALSPQGARILDRQVDFLLRNGEYGALIEGHADERGTRDYNIALGARRAASVRDYLVSRGVARNRLDTVSYGKERPVELCSDESCYVPNRRAVTVLNARSNLGGS